MKLLTKSLEKRFKEVGSQRDNPDPVVIASYSVPTTLTYLYATEYDPETRTFYGYITSDEGDNKWDYFSLDEMERVLIPPGLRIERDLECKEFPVSNVVVKD